MNELHDIKEMIKELDAKLETDNRYNGRTVYAVLPLKRDRRPRSILMYEVKYENS